MKRNATILTISGIVLPVLMLVISGCGKNDDVSDVVATDYWLTDFDKAKQLAQQQHKDILINFAGSDWCYWCKKLDKEVFTKAAFHDKASGNYVFLLIDFPQDKSGQSTEIQQQNEQLAQRFDIEGFPTVLLTDADGRPYARTGYIEGGAQAYLEHLRELGAQKALP